MKSDTPSSRSSRHTASFHGWFSLLLAALIALILNYMGFKYYVHQDMSKSQFYSLSPKTVDVLKNLHSPVTITTMLAPAYQNQIDALLKEYQRLGGKNIVVQKLDPAYDVARAAEMQKRLGFDGSQNLLIFEYKDAHRFVPQEDLFEVNPMTQQVGGFKGEQKITASILTLVEGHSSKIYYTEGHGEHDPVDAQNPHGAGLVNATLKQENIETATLNLGAKGAVPEDADAVVIAGPTSSFSPAEAGALDAYLAHNGKLLVLLDPYVTLGLDDVLKKYGLKYDNDSVLYRAYTATGTQQTFELAPIFQTGFSTHPITAKFAQAKLQLVLRGARSVTLLPDDKGQPNPKTQFLLQTDQAAWGWTSKSPVPSGAEMSNLSSLTYNKTTDLPGPVTVAAEYDGGTVTDASGKETMGATRIVAVGSARFLENDLAESVGANFFINAVDWLAKKDPVLDIAPKVPQQYGVSLSPLQERTLLWTALVVVPGAALLLGLMAWLSRRK